MKIATLQQEMVQAMKSGDKFRKNTISTIIARIKNTAIDKDCRDNIPEDIVDAELLKAKKITQEMIDSCPASRQDLLEDYKKQMEIVCEFAPTLMTDETEIRNLIYDSINGEIEFTKPNRGKIMKIISPVFKGKADMSVVSKVVGEMLK